MTVADRLVLTIARLVREGDRDATQILMSVLIDHASARMEAQGTTTTELDDPMDWVEYVLGPAED